MTADSIFLKSLKNESGKVTRKLANKKGGKLTKTPKLKGDRSRKEPRLADGEPGFEPTEISKTDNEVASEMTKDGVEERFKGQRAGEVKGQFKGEM